MSPQQPNGLTRSEFLLAATGDGNGAAAGSLFDELDDKIRAGMRKYGIPGVAMGMIYQGTPHIKGYGVTNVDYPLPVDGDTLFRVASNTKTVTGTAAMRLVEMGKLDLDARVREYLPHFATSQPSVARRVTVRQLLNHTPGWHGDCFSDMGRGDDALARYAEGIERLPQLTPLGETFFYNNTAIMLAGHVIEAATGSTYEDAIRELVLDPLGMDHTYFFSDEIVGFNVAASHDVVDGKPAVDAPFWYLPRTLHSTGGLISSVRDLLRYARFHLGDGKAPDGTRLLTKKSLVAMRSNPGPGGAFLVELDGVGVTWMLRPSREGVRIVEHGGDYAGQHSGFVMVPERGFALTMFTNSDSGPKLIHELFYDDWALRRFAGVSNLPAEPRALSRSELAPYEGLYTGQTIDPPGLPSGTVMETSIELKGTPYGRLRMTRTDSIESVGVQVSKFRLAFYREDYVLVYDEGGEPTFERTNFLRGNDGSVQWLRCFGARIFRHQGV
jgi:CubicO group peptidase (beta-lactamase class C family)